MFIENNLRKKKPEGTFTDPDTLFIYEASTDSSEIEIPAFIGEWEYEGEWVDDDFEEFDLDISRSWGY
jgi:hypothetical protein